MEQTNHKPIYGPDEWDIDFSFDLDFTFSEYLLIGCYLIFVVPVELMIKAIGSISVAFFDLFTHKGKKESLDHKGYHMVSAISKNS